MKKSLPCFTTLAAITLTNLVWASGPESVTDSSNAPAAVAATNETAIPDPYSSSPLQPVVNSNPDETPVGDRLLTQATAQLERRASVTARMRHQIDIAGMQLYGVGNYWQQGSGEALKVRLELQIAAQEAQLLQVCNSRFLWLDRKLPTGRTVTRVDLRKLRADPTLGAPNLDEIRPGEANWSSLHSELTQFTGGMPKLLTALGDNFNFMPPQAMRLAIAPPLASEPTSVPVFAVVGHWKPGRLEALLAKTPATPTDGQQAAAPPKPTKRKRVPERMPEEVLLLVGQSDLFPYRIEYRHLETPDIVGGDGQQIPYQLSTHPLVVLELSNVTFDAPIAASQFDYAPGDTPWTGQTTAVLDQLRQQHQAQVATRPGTESATIPTRQ